MIRARVGLTVLTVVIVLIPLSNMAPANLIVNGGFKRPVVPANEIQPLGAILRRKIEREPREAGAHDRPAWRGHRDKGLDSMDLTGISSTLATGFQQTGATVLGTTDDPPFRAGNVAGFLNPAASSTVDVFSDGVPALAATNTGGGTPLGWQQFTTSSTGTGATTTTGVVNGDPRTDEKNGLDNIVLTARPDPVPEPAPFLVLAAGLAGLAALRLCQKHWNGHRRGSRRSMPPSP